MISACITTPAVVPRPSSSTCGSVIVTLSVGCSFVSRGRNMYSPNTPSVTTLLATGAHAPGLNTPLVLRIAMNTANIA